MTYFAQIYSDVFCSCDLSTAEHHGRKSSGALNKVLIDYSKFSVIVAILAAAIVGIANDSTTDGSQRLIS